jgi:hypothetical protein
MATAMLTALGGCVVQLGDNSASAHRAAGQAAVRDVDVDDDFVADPNNPAVVVADDDEAPAPAPLPPWDTAPLFTGARDGRISGAIGPASNLDLPTDIAHVYDDGYFTEIAVYALRNDGQRVMIQLQIDSIDGQPFFHPGIGKRLAPGYTTAGNFSAMACMGPDSGDEDQPFEDTPFDDVPCEVGVDTEQDPDAPQALVVTVQAVFADENGDCPEAPGGGLGDGDFGEEDLPDLDGDGDGDLPGCGDNDGGGGDNDGDLPGADTGDGSDVDVGGDPSPEPNPGSGDGFHPLASSTFTMTR